MKTHMDVLMAAARLFASYGYKNTSMAAIGTEAGVTTGAVYFHFASKPDIAQAIVNLQHELSTARARTIVNANYAGVETMTHLSASFGRDIIFNPVVRAGTALTTDVLLFPQPYRKPWEDWFEILTLQLTRGISDGDVRSDTNIDALAHLIGPAFSGIQLVSGILNEHHDLLQRLRELSEALIPSFAAAGRERPLTEEARRIFALYETEVDAARESGRLPQAPARPDHLGNKGLSYPASAS